METGVRTDFTGEQRRDIGVGWVPGSGPGQVCRTGGWDVGGFYEGETWGVVDEGK